MSNNGASNGAIDSVTAGLSGTHPGASAALRSAINTARGLALQNASATPNSIASESTEPVIGAAGGSMNQNNVNMSLNETTTVAATTVFVNDSNEKLQEVRPVSLDSELAVSKTDDNSIALFMAKPVQIDTLVWTSASAANTTLTSYSVSDYLTGASVPNIWKNKISGYNLMRGTAVFRFILNAQPFQAGRLLLHFLPNEKNFSAYADTYVKVRNACMCLKTQHPNVELDVQDGNATIKIPYISPALWYSRDQGFDWGTLYVDVLSALRSASSTTVNASVYLHFEDFELAGPIYGPEGLMDGLTDAWNNAKRERNRTKDSGVVTTFFDFVKTPLSTLSSVPSIGPVAGLASGVAKSLGDFTSYFGWSRPYDMKGTQIVKQHNMYRGFNFNGTTTSDVLAMDATNQLVPMTHFAGSEVDEMSFNYLKTIPAYIDRKTWNTGQATNAQIYNLAISPSSVKESFYVNVGGSVRADAAAYPPFAYLGRYFRYYRGSISFTIKIVKTQFHSGRLAVTFTPTSNSSFVPTNAEGRSYVYREIIDVRESDTFNFVLPYIHPSPYLNTGFLDTDSIADEVFGYLDVRVLNPLVAASTVSSEVEVLVYANAGEDFQYSAIQPTESIAYCPEMNTDIPRISGPIGDAPQGKFTIATNALCTGEMFTSVKQLLNMLRPVGTGGFFGDYLQPLASNANFLGAAIYPYNPGLPRAKSVGPAAGVFTDPFTLDYVGEIASGYAYSRGAIRLSIPQAGDSTVSSYAWHTVKGSGAIGLVGGASPLPMTDTSSGVYVFDTSTNKPKYQNLPAMTARNGSSTLVDVITPAYGQTPFRLNYISSSFGGGTIPLTYDSPDYIVNIAVQKSASDKVLNHVLYRSGADDYACGYFLGFPPVITALDPIAP